MLAISNTFDTASIHAAGSTSWLDERTTSARRALVKPARQASSSSQLHRVNGVLLKKLSADFKKILLVGWAWLNEEHVRFWYGSGFRRGIWNS